MWQIKYKHFLGTKHYPFCRWTSTRLSWTVSLRLAGSPPQSGIHCPGNCEVLMRTSRSWNSRDRDVSPGKHSRGKERGIILPVRFYVRKKHTYTYICDTNLFPDSPTPFFLEATPTSLSSPFLVITTTVEWRKVLSWIFMICSFSARLPEIVDPDTITDDKIKTFR